MYKSGLTNNHQGDNNYNGGSDGSSSQSELKFDGKAAGIIGIVVAGSLIMAGVWLDAFKRWARTIIWVCLIASPVVFFAAAILFFVYLDNVVVGIVFIICAAFNALYVYLVRSQIAFSATILSIVVQVLQMYPSVTATAFGAIFLQVGWVFIWVIAAAGCMHSFKNQEKSTYNAQDGTTTTTNNNGAIGVVWFFLVLSFFWTATVIRNVCHVTTAGVIATWSAEQHYDNHRLSVAEESNALCGDRCRALSHSVCSSLLLLCFFAPLAAGTSWLLTTCLGTRPRRR